MFSRLLRGVIAGLDRIDARLEKIIRRERDLNIKLVTIMATVAELTTAVADMAEAVTKIGIDVTAAIADIQALQSQPGGINPTDLDPIKQGLSDAAASLNAAATSLEAVLPAPAPKPA
jgi:hypothetical protein